MKKKEDNHYNVTLSNFCTQTHLVAVLYYFFYRFVF